MVVCERRLTKYRVSAVAMCSWWPSYLCVFQHVSKTGEAEKKRARERMSERENAGERAMILRDQGNEEEVVLKREGDVVSRRE